MHKISVPISVPVTKKKKFYLNLNQYRNAHHFTLAKAKVNFHQIVEPKLSHLPRFDRIDLVYTLFTGTEQLCDTSNICSIVDKFFSDVLVSCKLIEDDNRKFVLSALYRYGGLARNDPHVEVTIIPSVTADQADQQEEEPMQIIIVQSEIEEAIEARIREQLVIQDGYRVDIELKATRGEDGYQALIDIMPENAARKVRSTDDAPIQAAVKVAKAAPAAAAAPKATRQKAVTAPATPVVSEPVAEEVEAETETPFDLADETVTAEAAVEPQEEEAPAPPKRPSLFGNMTAPVNS